MSDQCKFCSLRGNLTECENVDCGHHENWYAKTMRDAVKRAFFAGYFEGYGDDNIDEFTIEAAFNSYRSTAFEAENGGKE